jgi:hypothetical protein
MAAVHPNCQHKACTTCNSNLNAIQVAPTQRLGQPLAVLRHELLAFVSQTTPHNAALQQHKPPKTTRHLQAALQQHLQAHHLPNTTTH